MKIAQVSPLAERVPPLGYGGTERIVAYLSDELVRQGHEVTLFASGDSLTDARLIAVCDQALRLDSAVVDPLAHDVFQLEQVIQQADAFDIIHFHTGYSHFPIFKRQKTPSVTTFHGRLDIADLNQLFGKFSRVPVISISESQRKPFPHMNWQATIYHGVPLDLYTRGDGNGGYLAFLGRICPEKRVDRAIEIAERVNMKLKIAAKIDAVDREYVEKEIAPILDHPLVEFIGECDGAEKEKFLGDAYALLFPIDWPEPFGLVMIEAMACGTPVIAYRAGSVPEVIDSGVTGFIVESIEEAIQAIDSVQYLDRRRCRQVFEERFSSARMAADYIKVYERLLLGRKRRRQIAAKATGITAEQAPLAASGDAALPSK
jgi:glycosyltransferase involved in cell wall biosynthesis